MVNTMDHSVVTSVGSIGSGPQEGDEGGSGAKMACQDFT